MDKKLLIPLGIRKIMRLSFHQFLLCAILCGASYAHETSGQAVLEKRVSLDVQGVRFKKVLSMLGEQADVRFFYSSNSIDSQRKVTLKAFNQRLDLVLKELLNPYSIEFTVSDGKMISLTPVMPGKESSIAVPELLEEKLARELRGRVADEKGGALPGVSILVKGTQQGLISDIDGRFSIEVANENAVLVFSFVGYVTQEVVVGNRTELNITLEVDEKSLEEVVVVGYGVTRKRDITGAVTSIGSEEIKAQPVSSFNQALQGRVPGVQVTQSSNAPGGGITVRVRGGNSISASNDPLYVIDGFPVTNPSAASGAVGSVFFPNPLASINPNDIESIEVLKDASATAIYGSRGANGVVLVTTRRGKEGQTNIEFESYAGVQKITKMFDMATAEEHTAAKNEQLRNLKFAERYGVPGGAYPKTPAEYGTGTNWQKEIFRVAPIQSYQLSFSGGTGKLRYVVSGNYFDQKGIIIASDFKRFTSRINLDAELNSRLKIGANFNVSRSYNNSVNEVGDGGLVGLALRISPASPVYDKEGNYHLLNVGPGSGFNSVANPVAVANTSTNLMVSDRMMGNFFGDIRIAEGLSARISLGADIFNTRRNIFYTPETLIGNTLNGYGSNGTSSNVNLLNENVLTYVKTLDNHAFDVVAGVTFQHNREERTYAEAQDFPNYTLGANNIGLANRPLPPSGSVREWGLNSYLGRLNYRFKDKYLFTFTSRLDGSSRFGANNKYGFFPSGAVGWRISDEAFLRNSRLVSDLKFRVSYGATGNDGIGLYNSLSQYSAGRTVFGDSQVLMTQASRIANPDLHWEKTNQFDIGLDAGLLQNRIQITADYYIKTTSDLLLNVQLPATTGFTEVTRNVGSLENRGFELGINTINVDGAFKWRTNANFSLNRNKVIKLNDAEEFFTGNSIVRVGESIGSFYGNIREGIWQTSEEIASAGPLARTGDLPGAIRYRDVDGDGSFNEATDRVILGNGLPKFIFGMTNQFTYKNFDFSFFIQGVQGNKNYNFTRRSMEQSDPADNLLRTVINGAWRADKPSNTLPSLRQWRLSWTDSYYLEDGSFIRLKNASLGYNVPLKTKYIRKMRAYVSGQNLVTITKYKGYDPEVNSDFNSNMQYGVDNYAYPAARTFLLGINLSF